MTDKTHLSIIEYVLLGVALLKALSAAVVAALTGFGVSNYGRHIKYAGQRALLRSTTIRQLQALAPTTRYVYVNYMKQHGLPVVEADLGNGTSGFWLGSKKAKTVLLWLHGGGYVLSAPPAYMDLLSNLISSVADRGSEIGVFFLEYTLAPAAQDPHQLKQAASALRYLVDTEGRKPSSILLAGDSAGGNLALALLSHISHPHPALESLRLRQNLRGAVMISPWVTFDQDSASMSANRLKDSLDVAILKTWSDAFMGDAKKNHYNHPMSAPSSWWQNLSVDDMCIIAGQDELFVDDIKELAQTIKIQSPSLETFIGQGEAHDTPLNDYVTGKSGGPAELFLRDWVFKKS